MFDISFPELVVIAIVGLLVIGPDRLPEALRTLGLWIGRMRRSFTNVKTEIEREIGMDEIRRQLHNEAVMEEMKRIERNVRDSVSTGASRPGGTEPTTPSAPTSSSQDHDSEVGPPGDEVPGEQPPASHGQRTSSGEGGSQAQTPADDRSDDQRHG